MTKINNKEFIKRSKQIHSTLYDYSEVMYINCKSKVIVKCRFHGEFEISPVAHWRGTGCPNCPKLKYVNKPKSNNNSKSKIKKLNDIVVNTQKMAFIDKANEVHKFKYDYSNINYKDDYTYIIINCKLHGEFSEIPTLHLLNYGCTECLYAHDLEIFRLNEAMLFINSANIMYNNKYEYDCSKFTTFFDDMCVTCPDHGEYTLTPFQHLNGLHCYYCDDHKYV